jgi:signal transduction histidine kinase
MPLRLVIIIWLSFGSVAFAGQDEANQFLLLLNQLKFDEAKVIARAEKDPGLRSEMLQLADILFYQGQIPKDSFKISTDTIPDNIFFTTLATLNKGYLDLYYNRVNGHSYRYFYDAFQLAKAHHNPVLMCACLHALLRYYNSEVGQNTDYHLPYLEELERIQANTTDSLWVVIYRMIFFTQANKNEGLENGYFAIASSLNKFEGKLEPESPLLTYVFYESGIQHGLKNDLPRSIEYYNKAIRQAKNYPFLRYFRFNARFMLMSIEANRGNFVAARRHLTEAKKEVDRADALRSDFSVNIYSAQLMKAENKHDSAFNFLWNAIDNEFQLSAARNSLEIARLNVELETQEKENSNLSLRENRIWLLSALIVVALLFVASYLAYTNQRSKNKIQQKEKEVQSMKLEKLLKDQEIFGIDAMLEGQERERQKIADDLHDNLGSLLTTIKFNFQGLLKKKGLVELELLQKTDGLLEEAYQKVRAIAHAGNAGVNAKDGLLPSIKNFVGKISSFNQLSIQIEEHGMDERLDNSLEIMIFRMVQELITNVIKHAQASEVILHLTKHDGVINLMLEDNGVGFDISQIKAEETMGLYSIQKKIENLGGQVTIDSILNKGTTVIIDIPVR